MKDNFIINTDNKNFSISKNWINLCLTLEKSQTDSLSLKNIVRKKILGAVVLENLKIQIILAEDVHVDVIDDLLDFDITRSMLEFVLNKGSTINYELKIIDSQAFSQTDDGVLISYNKQGCVEKELDFKFVGKYSEAKIKCFCKGTHNRFFRVKTVQDHQVGNTKSDLVIKGAFCHQAKLFCDSLIKVDKNAQKVEVSQLNKNLLLGCNSRVVSIPKLEVKADDVKCKHGSAISKVDEDQLFYLQSRGMDYCQAKNLLIDAFLN